MAELVAGPFVTFVVKRLGNLLIQEGQFLGGVRGQVQQLQTELNMMQGFLQAADARQEVGDEIVIRNCVAEIREATYDAEDVIATFVVKVAFRGRDQFPYVLKRYLCIFKEYRTLRKVGLEIDAINTRINISLTRRSQICGILHSTGVRENSSTPRLETQRQLRRSYTHTGEEDVVGIEEDLKTVVGALVNQKTRYRVVSICGMGGLGKTTLAKRVYNHSEIKRYFDCFAWAYISQKCNTREVLEGILIKLLSPKEERKEIEKLKHDELVKEERKEIEKLKHDELVKRLYQVQSQKKCLVILDDIWEDTDWDNLNPAFPNNTEAGSKILLTTRNKEVAKHVDQQGFLYELRFLTQEQSWELFEKKTSRTSEGAEFTLSTEFIELGKEMVKHCGGLPLAIVVLGGLLATKHKLNEWEMVRTNISHYLGKGKGQGGVMVQDILALSYQDLPYHLKACFLCLGHLPEDHDIHPEKLIQIWMAEGIVLSPIPTRAGEMNEEVSMLDVGMSYLSELVQRCMIQVQLTKFSKRIKLCRLHDLMRDLCLLKAKEENFLKIVRIEAFGDRFVWADSTSSSSSSSSLTTIIRRLVVYGLGEPERREYVSPVNGHEEMKNHHHIRSCQFYWFNWELRSSSWRQIKSFLKGLTLLTILDLEGIVFSGKSRMLPKATGNLIHLRFLSVRNSCIKSIPSSIGNLRFLQTLDLNIWRRHVRIPNVLWKLEQLRHLYLPFDIKRSYVGKLRLDGLNKLEILDRFDTKHFDVRCFRKLTNLRKVGVDLVGPKDLAVILKSPILNNSNRLLQYFFVCIRGDFQIEEEQSLLRQLLGCHHLHELTLVGSLNLVKLPDQFPPNLTELTLWNTKLEEDPMPKLEKFPNLRRLQLCCDFYIGKEMVCSAPTTTTTTPTAAPSSSSVGGGNYGCDGGFPQLKYLYLYEIENLEEWRVEKGAMPNLFNLEILGCRKLKEIPDGLRFITTLRELEISGVSEALKDRVREGGDDFDKVQQVPSIKIM